MDWQSFGGGVATAFITGATTLAGRRSSRISRLEQEVEACKARDAQVIVIKAGFRLLVGALERREPGSPELAMCRDLLRRKLPMTAEEMDLSGFEDLLSGLDEPSEN